jgi:hypothetical protein
MSFWKSLFGGGSAPAAAPKPSAPESYKDFLISAAPVQNGKQFQAAGLIVKEIGGVRREHHFIRADFFASQEDATTFSVNKARQIVDLMGDRMFDS